MTASLIRRETFRPVKVVLAICSSAIGAGLVAAAVRFSFLNWIVDVPGWFVSRIVPINFHEGEGAFGFFVAIFVSWLCVSLAIWILILAMVAQLQRIHSNRPDSKPGA